MKLTIRRIGNSLGVIVPRVILDSWGVAEGDWLEVDGRAIRPPGAGQAELDGLKRSISLEVVRRFEPAQIRAQILANLHRWKKSGAWVSAYNEWQEIAKGGDDGALFAAMLGQDETAHRLRQSMPYVGLLPREVVRTLNEKASA